MSGGARGGTLLNKLGFRDPDRSDPMHDAACAYVAANARKVCERLFRTRMYSAQVQQERIISKGEGQYKTTVGFADLYITATPWAPAGCHPNELDTETLRLCREHKFVLPQEQWVYTHSEAAGRTYALGVEVKWSESSISDALRQIAVYQDFTRWKWALATPRTLNLEQRKALDSRGLWYIQLSENNVRAFAAQQRSTSALAEVAI